MEQAFDRYSELDQILKFSTPKVLRLVEILRQVRPQNFVDPRKRRDKSENSEAAKSGTAQVEEPVSNGAEATVAEEAEVAVVQAVADGASNPSVEILVKDPKSLDDHESENFPKNEASSSTCESPPVTQETSSTEGTMDVESEDVHAMSCSKILDQAVDIIKCNGCADQEELNLLGTGDVASPCMVSSKQQHKESQALIVEEVPHIVAENDVHGGSPSTECCGDREPKQITESTMNTSECQANGWSSSRSDSLDTLDSTVNDSCLPGKSECEGESSAEVKDACPHDCLEGKCLHNGAVEEKCGEPSKVQIHPDSTQICCNIPESLVTKQTGCRSTLEEDLCRLNLRESSLRVGCEHENSTNCDVNNGTMSAKSHLLDAAKVHSSISAPLCNGYQSGSEENLPSSRVTTDNTDSQSSKEEQHVCSTQDEAKECPQSPEPSHSVQSSLSHSEIHQPEESSALTNAQITTSQPACESAATSSPTTPETTTDTTPPSATTKDADSTAATPAVSSEAAAMADTLALLLPGGKGGRRRRDEVKEKVKVHNPEDPDSVCGLVFVHHRNMAKIIYRLLKVSGITLLALPLQLCQILCCSLMLLYF